MKMVGGVIGLIAGIVLAVVALINVFEGSGASSEADEQIVASLEAIGVTVEGGDYVAAIDAKLEELRATEGADPAMISALETMQAGLAEATGALGDYMTWFYIAIIGGVVAAIVGFLAIKGTGVAMPGLLAAVGAVLTVLAFLLASAHTLSWILGIVILVGGVVAFLGAKQSPAPAA
jgi:hypothetical protein